MMLNQKIIERRRALSIVIALFAFLVILIAPKIIDNINSSVESMFSKVNGESLVDSNIVIIKITEKDAYLTGRGSIK